MNECQTIGDLFDEEPIQWGLRGDPYLWRDFREHFKDSLLPVNRASFLSLIHEAFETLTGHKFEEKEPFRLKKYAHGGMSSGMISPEFWRGPGLTILLERYERT